MKKWNVILALILATLLMTGAQAETVRFVGEECPIPIASELGGNPETMPCAEISFLGQCEGGSLLVLNEDQLGYVDLADLQKLLENEIEFDDLPLIPYPETVRWDSSKEAAAYVQQLLIDAGYLDGKADGIFGNGTMNAIMTFQTEMGLPATGEVDLMTQALLLKALQGDDVQEIAYPIAHTVEQKFAAIFGRTDRDLEAFLAPEWRFNYDGFEGTGTIEAKLKVGGYLNDRTVLDRIAVTAELLVLVTDGTTDAVKLTPALRIVAEGTGGTYVQSVSLKSGNAVVKLETPQTTRTLQGTVVHEEAVFELTDEAMALLRGVGEETLSIRVNGTNNTYDLNPDGAKTSVDTFLDVSK